MFNNFTPTLRSFASTLLIICVAFLLTSPLTAQTSQLPISAFLNAASATATEGWLDPVSNNSLFIDMYGKRAAALSLSLGTTIKGKVTVQALPDGMRQVTVNIHTKNAVCWGRSNGLLAFGY